MRTDLMPNIRYWFPTPVYDVNLGEEFLNNNSKYLERAINYRDTVKKTVLWKCDTYTTLDTVDLRTVELFSSLISKCREHVLNFSTHFGCVKPVVCQDAWLNVASTGQYQEYHIHPGSHFSLVYYVNAPENCGDLIFRSFNADNMFPIPVDKPTEVSNSTARYTPENARLLIFPSHLSHLVCKNESQDDRVSISMNFALT